MYLFSKLIVVASLGALASSCGKDESSETPPTPAAITTPAPMALDPQWRIEFVKACKGAKPGTPEAAPFEGVSAMGRTEPKTCEDKFDAVVKTRRLALSCGMDKVCGDVLPYFPFVEELDLFGLMGAKFRETARFTNLKKLYISTTDVTDVAFLQRLPHLEVVVISTSPLSDVRPLAKFPKLRLLSFTRLEDFFGERKLTVAKNAKACPIDTPNAVFNAACVEYIAEKN
jgi:Leucine-rich repeat (LRR) protein